MREVCVSSLLRKPIIIGEQAKTVEVDESCFSRRTFGLDCEYAHQWLFVGTCRVDKDRYPYAVPDRTAETLLKIIRATISPVQLSFLICRQRTMEYIIYRG